MKKLFRYAALTALAATMTTVFSSCEKDGGEITDYDQMYQEILDQYVSVTVVPTYKALAEAALEMRTANEALKTTCSDANMQAASTAWMKARIQWELSEAFLFGPVGENALDIDGHIDSWPLELTAIQTEIDKGGDLGGADVWAMEPEVIGFHVTEYLLYRNGQTRSAADVTPAELNYLVAATDALVWDCVLAYVSWVGEENVSVAMKDVLRENSAVKAHLEANPGFKNFAGKLTGKIDYPSWGAALSEIAVGCAEIAGEVGTTKIAGPYDDRATEKVESWYSWHSLADYENNIISIKRSYLNGSPCLSDYVKLVDSRFDDAVRAKIDDCIAKIQAMGTGGKSFYEVVRDQINSAQVQAASDACVELQRLFEQIEDIIE